MWIVYSFLVLVVIGLGLLLYMYVYEPHKIQIKHIELQGDITKDITIVHITDTHFTHHFGVEKAEEIVEKIQELQPDMIVFTGDFMDFYEKTPHLKTSLPPVFAKLHAPYGKYAVYGNHDIGGGAKHVYASMMSESGFQLLFNDVVEIKPLQIALFGIDDDRLGYADIKLCEKKLQPYQILLSHEPDLIDTMNTTSIHLALCGHTHGGQVALPILRNLILPKGGKHYRKGLYKKEGTQLFVSSGIGTTKLRLRFCNLPEICALHIYKQK